MGKAVGARPLRRWRGAIFTWIRSELGHRKVGLARESGYRPPERQLSFAWQNAASSRELRRLWSAHAQDGRARSGLRRGLLEAGRRLAGPAAERADEVPEVRIAEPLGDLVDREIVRPEEERRSLSESAVAQRGERGVLVRQTPPQG